MHRRLRAASPLLALLLALPACGSDDGPGVRTIDEAGSASASGSASGSAPSGSGSAPSGSATATES